MQSLEVKSFTQLPEKAQKLIKEHAEMKSQIESMESKLVHDFLVSGEKKSNADLDIIMKAPLDMNFKTLGVEAKQIFAGKNVLLATTAGNFLLFTQPGNSAKMLAQKLGLKG